MPKAPPVFRPAGYNPTQQKNEKDRWRESASKRGYNSKWRKARLSFLRKNPLCVRCKADDRVMPADVVDHIVPHKGDKGLFWDKDNWQALCKTCHDRKTATEDSKFLH